MEDNRTLVYNTEKDRLVKPEYGRAILDMVNSLKKIESREKRSEQARAVIKAMEIINYDVHRQENFEHKLWDDLFIISGYDLDIDAPYPMPNPEQALARPEVPSVVRKPIRATQYGRNIESMINLVADMEDGEVKTAVIRSLAIYMRTQYLIWNKDSVADVTIFQDIEKLSDGRIKVPEGVTLGRVGADSNYLKPGQNPRKQMNQRKKNNKKYR
ncbi:MAG: DUF4290 domain-containing protein [Candidatus Cryptobacteroides sp.]|nr:DUF4290 domain-containing protein [Candidatus Cryptobacteroides sp.]